MALGIYVDHGGTALCKVVELTLRHVGTCHVKRYSVVQICQDLLTAFRRTLVVKIIGFEGSYTESFVSICNGSLYQADACEQNGSDEVRFVGHHLLASLYKNRS